MNCSTQNVKPDVRYIATAKISDPTGEIWVSVYDPVAATLFQKTGKEIKDMVESNGENGM